MPTIAQSIADLHSGADFLHDVATGPASGAGSTVTNPVDATAQDTVAKTIADAKTAILTDTYLKAVVKEVTDTAYTCLAADTGKIILLNNASAITVTVPTGLDVGWNATFVQEGAGQATFSVSGTTLDNFDGNTKTAGANAVCSLFQKKTNVFHLAGETSS